MEIMKKYLIRVLIMGMAPLASCQDRIPKMENEAPAQEQSQQARAVAVVLPQDGADFTVKKGDIIEYSREVWGSVGETYSVNYDDSAFRMEYLDSKEGKPVIPGGDESVGTTYLEALKKGKFEIEIVHKFRGKTKKVVKYNITVK